MIKKFWKIKVHLRIGWNKQEEEEAEEEGSKIEIVVLVVGLVVVVISGLVVGLFAREPAWLLLRSRLHLDSLRGRGLGRNGGGLGLRWLFRLSLGLFVCVGFVGVVADVAIGLYLVVVVVFVRVAQVLDLAHGKA